MKIDTIITDKINTSSESRVFVDGIIPNEGMFYSPELCKIFKLNQINTSTVNQIITTITVGTSPEMCTYANGFLWVSNTDDGTVSKINTYTSSVVQTFTLSSGTRVITQVGSHIYISNSGSGLLSRINCNTNVLGPTLTLSQVFGTFFDGSYLWVSCYNGGTSLLIKINPTTNVPIFTITTASNNWGNITSDGQYIWINTDSYLIKINPDTKALVTTITIDGYNIFYDGEGIWIRTNSSPRFLKYNISSYQIMNTIYIGASVNEKNCFDGRYIWIGNLSSSQLIKIDTKFNINVMTISLVNAFGSCIDIDGYLWVCNRTTPGTITKFKIF
jgi:hypothetical protein